MKTGNILLCVGVLLFAPVAHAADGLIELKSPHSVQQTINRLEKLAQQNGLKIFVRIDHAAGAASVGKTLRDTELLIFGNPQGGTPLMQCAQTVAIDLPLKALAWQDETGQVWLAYNDPVYLARRHGAADCAAVDKLEQALAAMTASAVAP